MPLLPFLGGKPGAPPSPASASTSAVSTSACTSACTSAWGESDTEDAASYWSAVSSATCTPRESFSADVDPVNPYAIKKKLDAVFDFLAPGGDDFQRRQSGSTTTSTPRGAELLTVEQIGPGEFKKHFAKVENIDQTEHAQIVVVQHRSSGEKLAAKIQPKHNLRSGDRESVHSVARLMLNMPAHENVVKVHAMYEDKLTFYTVMDACMGGDLFKLTEQLEKDDPPQFERQLLAVMTDILLGLSHLHEHNVRHNDVKLENFVLTEPTTAETPIKSHSRARAKLEGAINRTKAASALSGSSVKIIDFDFVCPADEKEHAVIGTDGYIAPEAYKGKPTAKSDVFSAGVVMFALVTNKFPFPDSTFDGAGNASLGNERILEKYQRAHLAVKWDGVWDSIPAAREFCQKLMSFRVRDRPTAQEALEDEWIRGMSKRGSRGLRTRRTCPN